jgi:hypothetical protein
LSALVKKVDLGSRLGATGKIGMAIDLLVVCEWTEASVHKEEYREPSWELVEIAIRDLNGQSRNDLYLQAVASDRETYLAVGGGGGRYLVSGSLRGESFPTVISGSSSDSKRESLVVGGQAGDYPRNWILDLDTALRAAKSYFQSGEFGGGEAQWVNA